LRFLSNSTKSSGCFLNRVLTVGHNELYPIVILYTPTAGQSQVKTEDIEQTHELKLARWLNIGGLGALGGSLSGLSPFYHFSHVDGLVMDFRTQWRNCLKVHVVSA